MSKGKLIILSAPSGCGKSTIIGEIIKNPSLNLAFSISATTRLPREGEKHGVNYYFLSEEDFKQAIANEELVEYEEVYPGRFYGTLKSEIDGKLAKGQNMLFDVDVVGGLNIKKYYGDNALAVFVQPPSVEVLRERLVGRATDSEEMIEKRLAKAEWEMEFAPKFDVRIVNDNLDEAVAETIRVVTEFLR